MLEIKNKQQWDEHVLEQYPKEACGLVVQGEIIIVDNVAEDPLEYFSLKTNDVIKYSDVMEGVVHSHIKKKEDRSFLDRRIPSKPDMVGQINTNVWWGISATEGESTTDFLWFGKDRNQPYTERQFIYNVQDCFELVRDYYRRELQYNIHPYARDWDWFQTENLFEENFEKEGFVEVPYEEVQVHDVIMMNLFGDKVNHIGVYLGEDKLLHHLRDRLSGTDTMARWKRQIKKVVRRV